MKLHALTSRWLRAVLAAAVLAVAPAVLSAQSAGETYYTKRDGVALQEGATLSAKSIAELVKGVPVQVVDSSGTRFRVRVEGVGEGYISKLHLTDKAPAGGPDKLKLFTRDDVGASEQANVDSIRGLKEASSEVAAIDGMSPAVEVSLARVEQRGIAVTDSDIDSFLAEGGITPL